MSGLVVGDLRVEVAGGPIINGAGFEAQRGQVTGLIGPNGAGKSTLFQCLIGARAVSGGEMAFDGADLAAMARLGRARLIALVEQSVSTDERLTARDVAGLGRVPWQTGWNGSGDAADRDMVDAALAETCMTAFAGRDYNSLSGGERQMTQLARALAQEPQLLILDEPTNHLDLRAQLSVFRILRRRAAGGAAVLISLHDLNQAARHCDRLIVLSKGRTVAEGAPDKVLTVDLLRAVYGLNARLIADPAGGVPIIVPEAEA